MDQLGISILLLAKVESSYHANISRTEAIVLRACSGSLFLVTLEEVLLLLGGGGGRGGYRGSVTPPKPWQWTPVVLLLQVSHFLRLSRNAILVSSSLTHAGSSQRTKTHFKDYNFFKVYHRKKNNLGYLKQFILLWQHEISLRYFIYEILIYCYRYFKF